jgi:hypothetical protein
MSLTKVSYSMISGATFNVADFGAVGDGVTNDTAAIQLALNALRDNGGVLVFQNFATYKCTAALTLQLASSAPTRRFAIEGQNAVLSFTTLTSGEAFTVGATAVGFFNEFGSTSISNLNLLGPEPAGTKTETPTSSTVGLFLNFAHNVILKNVQTRRFYTGIKTGYVFPLNATSCNVANNFIGLYMQNASNLHKWQNLSAKECRYSVLIFDEGLYGGGRIDDVYFDQLLTEDSLVGVHVDTGTGASVPRIRNLKFDNGFYTGVVYDIFRLALTFTFATPATRGAARTAQLYDSVFHDGKWNSAGYSATSAAVVFGGTAVRGFDGRISAENSANSIVGTPVSGQILFKSDEITFASNWNYVYYNSNAVTNEQGTWTPQFTFATLGDLSVTYVVQVATYSKVNNLVTVNCVLTTSAFTHTTAAGDFRIIGLPFTAKNTANLRAVGSMLFDGITKAGFTQFTPRTTAGSAVVSFIASASATGTSAVSATNVPSGGTPAVTFSMTYEV